MRAERGFSIIEMMVTVAIIGILAVVSTPLFLGALAKARQAEAKTNLGGIGKAQLAYYVEADSFTDNLAALGWKPEGDCAFNIGFTSDAVPSPSGRNDLVEMGYSTSKMINTYGLPLTQSDLPPSPVSQNGFTIGAVGNVDYDLDLDKWTYNDAGVMTNVTPD